MKIKPHYALLALFYIMYVAFRLMLSLQTDYFSNDYSYFALRQIDHIEKTGLPLVYDDLSYSGRVYSVLPFYFYILAFFVKLVPGIATIKIVSNMIASLIIPFTFILVYKITSNRRASIISAVIIALLPPYLTETINMISVYSFMVPFGILMLYYFLKLDSKDSSLNYLIPLTISLVLTSSSVIYFFAAIVVYYILTYLENKGISGIELEYGTFFILFYLWVNFIFYKYAFQLHGFMVFWGNLPKAIFQEYFSLVNPLQLVLGIGILPILAALYTIYNYLFAKKDKDMTLLISLFFTSFIVLWLKLSELNEAYLFLAISLILIFGVFLRDMFLYVKKTKFSEKSGLITLISIIVILASLTPGILIAKRTLATTWPISYFDSFKWLRENTKENDIVFGLPGDGHLITYFGKRRNVIDTEFMLIDDIDTRYDDVKSFFSLRFKIDALRILKKYDASYFIMPENSNNALFNEDVCFILRYQNQTRIYQINPSCDVE